jgi:glutamine synthetase
MSVQKQLQEAGVQYVRILWCDNANIIRGKAAHISLLADGLPDGVGIAMAQQALPVMYDAVVADSGLSPVGEARLVPDWSTLKLLPYAPTHAQVIGNMLVDGQPWEHCPREYLRSQIRALGAVGLSAYAAFENEFFMLRRTAQGYEPADTTVFAATGAMNQQQDFLRDLTRALEAQGLQPEFYYPESAPGQQELSIRYADALRAADNQITYRETVRGIAPAHGYVASFLPKVYDQAAGSGCHLNLSLWQEGENVLGDAAQSTGLSTFGQHFIAGILAHLSGLTALTIPTRNSFRRIRPHFWAGAFRAWGYDNREAAVRVTRGKNGASRFELKTCDASANPYLALGAVIAAGLDGIQRVLALPPEVTIDPGHMPEAERHANGVDLLPSSLGQALAALAQDAVLLASLGTARARTYMAVKKTEWDALKEMSLEEEVKMLAERY